jgi:diguanylate cyclase (GGDEF)-like protein
MLDSTDAQDLAAVPPAVLDALSRLAEAEGPTEARRLLDEVHRSLGPSAEVYTPLLEILCRRASEVSRLRHLAGSDALTGLANRRAFHQALTREHARWTRGGAVMAVVLLDVDGLKALNDAHGHAAGDEAIVATAQALRAAVRKTDVVARVGGDEFAVLLTDTSAGRVYIALDRMRDAVQSQVVAGRPLRISAGMALPGPDASTVEELLEEADTRLYADKAARKRARRGVSSVAAHAVPARVSAA